MKKLFIFSVIPWDGDAPQFHFEELRDAVDHLTAIDRQADIVGHEVSRYLFDRKAENIPFRGSRRRVKGLL